MVKAQDIQWGREAQFYGDKLGLPRSPVRSGIRIGKAIRHPKRLIEIHKQYPKLIKNKLESCNIPDKKGFAEMDVAELPSGEEALSVATEIYEEADTENLDASGPYIHQLLDPQEVNDYPDILDFVLSDELLGLVAEYLGTVPKLQTVQLWYTPPNNTKKGSQQFHIDQLDDRQFKLFLFVNDIDEDSGPFTLIPADKSSEISEKLNYHERKKQSTRVDDEEIFSHCSSEDVIQAIGPRGTCYAVDTSRCFHYGGRQSDSERVMMMIQFTTQHSPMETNNPHQIDKSSISPNDKIRRLVL